MLRDLRRRWRRWQAARRNEPRRRELLGQIRAGLGPDAVLVAAGARGRDSIYAVHQRGAPVAMARLVNPFLRRQPVAASMPYRVLEGPNRIQREWVSYVAGAERALTPEPLWHCEDALVCRFVPGAPLARSLAATPHRFWLLNARAAEALLELHALGLSHMDTSLANIIERADGSLAFIDFEYGAAPSLDLHQQFAYDHLRLIESAIKMVPADALKAYAPWFELLTKRLPDAVREADPAPLAPALSRLLCAAPLRAP